ncbi:hypothetical protein E2C01_059132 [Portunus trituberculatus]|uniref:Uncharacterized protein n=1 Tax=Portunus trituberculatus TaxID=210409 RepID=A0A5B7H595_PORTR|nr:hypothetical protein [Portunus trituberculatus]
MSVEWSATADKCGRHRGGPYLGIEGAVMFTPITACHIGLACTPSAPPRLRLYVTPQPAPLPHNIHHFHNL